MKGLFLVVFLSLSAALAAWDVGGSVEASSSGTGSTDLADWTLVSSGTTRFWLGGNPWNEGSLMVKFNVSDSYTTRAGEFANTVSGGLDTFLLETKDFRIGRTDFRDFSGQVLDTKLDGFQVNFDISRLNVRAFGGTSMFLFKSASTIILSEDDVKDRQVNEDWTHPATLWAPNRAVGGVEISARNWLPDQSFQLSLLAQGDLRPEVAVDGGQAKTDVAVRKGAPVSTAYAGLGWSGRLMGPLYGGARGFVMAGRSLTAVGLPETFTVDDKSKTQYEAQTWRASSLLAGFGSAEFTLLVPSLSYLLLDTGVQMGSWDADGPTPDKNSGESAASQTPSLYTGWASISRSGGAFLFNPQPANILRAHLIVSLKPDSAVQISSSTFAFARPIAADISEPGIDPSSQELYLGIESDLVLVWRPASDLSFTAGGGLFVPNPSALIRTNDTKLQASANVSF